MEQLSVATWWPGGCPERSAAVCPAKPIRSDSRFRIEGGGLLHVCLAPASGRRLPRRPQQRLQAWLEFNKVAKGHPV